MGVFLVGLFLSLVLFIFFRKAPDKSFFKAYTNIMS